MPQSFLLSIGISPLPACALDMSAFESLTNADGAIHKREQQEEHLRKCAKQVHESLSFDPSQMKVRDRSMSDKSKSKGPALPTGND